MRSYYALVSFLPSLDQTLYAYIQAVETIDGEMVQQLSIRRKQREAVGPALFDTSLYNQGYIGVLPESLRPKPGRLSHSQQRVYEV